MPPIVHAANGGNVEERHQRTPGEGRQVGLDALDELRDAAVRIVTSGVVAEEVVARVRRTRHGRSLLPRRGRGQVEGTAAASPAGRPRPICDTPLLLALVAMSAVQRSSGLRPACGEALRRIASATLGGSTAAMMPEMLS